MTLNTLDRFHEVSREELNKLINGEVAIMPNDLCFVKFSDYLTIVTEDYPHYKEIISNSDERLADFINQQVVAFCNLILNLNKSLTDTLIPIFNPNGVDKEQNQIYKVIDIKGFNSGQLTYGDYTLKDILQVILNPATVSVEPYKEVISYDFKSFLEEVI